MISYEIVPIDGILQTTVEGDLDFEGTSAILRQVAELNKVNERHLLMDLRGAEASRLSYKDVYRLVELLSMSPTAFTGRIALVDTFREGFEKVQFFQASATDQGFSVRAFLDEAAAVRWLEEAGPNR